MQSCDGVLESIRGAPPNDYRHLSVRSAVSIYLDRIMGPMVDPLLFSRGYQMAKAKKSVKAKSPRAHKSAAADHVETNLVRRVTAIKKVCLSSSFSSR